LFIESFDLSGRASAEPNPGVAHSQFDRRRLPRRLAEIGNRWPRAAIGAKIGAISPFD
jgi:hypothetical protein